MSTIAVAKSSMNWQATVQRPACQRCEYAQLVATPGGVIPKTRCIKGGFTTSPLAICDEYKQAVNHG